MYINENSNYADFKIGEIYLSIFSKEEMIKVLNYNGTTEVNSVKQVVFLEVQDLNKCYESLINKIKVDTEPTNREVLGIK